MLSVTIIIADLLKLYIRYEVECRVLIESRLKIQWHFLLFTAVVCILVSTHLM